MSIEFQLQPNFSDSSSGEEDYISSGGKDDFSSSSSLVSSSSNKEFGRNNDSQIKKEICNICDGSPAFLWHTKSSCPFEVVNKRKKIERRNKADFVLQREVEGKAPFLLKYIARPYELDIGRQDFHRARISCLEFHQSNIKLVLSGDRRGQLGVWDYVNQSETIYGMTHNYVVSSIKCDLRNDDKIYTGSSDGSVSHTDLRTGQFSCLLDLNREEDPVKICGLDINNERGLIFVGDDRGYLYSLDKRSNKLVNKQIAIHGLNSKVTGLHFNPARSDLLLSCGTDHYARIWDVRMLDSSSSALRPLTNIAHKCVVNSAYFSPISGTKIMTTSHDTRIRIWDFPNFVVPSREIVHRHDFHSHATPFRAEWDPKDSNERMAVIGRYLRNNVGSIPTIDIIDTKEGTLLDEIHVSSNVIAIYPLNKLHHIDDIIASTRDRSIMIWRPKQDEEEEEEEELRRTDDYDDL